MEKNNNTKQLATLTTPEISKDVINSGSTDRKMSVSSSDEEVAPSIRKIMPPPMLSLPIQGSSSVPQSSSSPLIISPGSQLNMTSRPMIGYIRPIQRRGNTYMVRDELPADDDDDLVKTDGTDTMAEDLYTETIRLSSAASRKATIFKVLYIMASILFVVGGTSVGILSIQGFETEITKYCVAIIGFIIAGIQTLMMTFSIEKRGVLLKDVSIKLRKVSRNVRALRNSDLKPKDKMKKLEEYYAEVDEYDLNIFDNSVTSATVTEATNVSQISIKRPTEIDSDPSAPGSAELETDVTTKKRSLLGKSKKNDKSVRDSFIINIDK